MRHSFLALFFCSFQLISIVSGQSMYADCASARIVCDKNPIFITALYSPGSLPESSPGTCFQKDFVETNSIWLKWKTAEAGAIDFTILPLNETDDIDFVLYRLRDLDNCTLKETIRCMAAGPTLGNEAVDFQSCTGATGLRAGADGTHRSNGCPENDENFLSPVRLEAGEYYGLFINNFRSAGGIVVEWSGTATFQQISEKCSPPSGPSTSLTLDSGGQIQFSNAFPSPATNQVSITALSDKLYSGNLQVIGSDGQLEMTQSFTLSPGNNTLDLPTENLRLGVHFIKLRTNNETHVLRFVKH